MWMTMHHITDIHCIGFSDKFYKEMLEFYSVENDRVLSGPRHDYVVDHRPDGM
jgi:hypothetical protein